MILFEKKYQTFDTVFHHQMKHLEVRQKYSAARRIFNSLLGVSSGDETLHLMFDILLLIGFWGPAEIELDTDGIEALYEAMSSFMGSLLQSTYGRPKSKDNCCKKHEMFSM